jgi:cystathionine beta-lyase
MVSRRKPTCPLPHETEYAMNHDFDTVIDRRGTSSQKWGRYSGRDIIAMWLADMDFRSPPMVIEALHRCIDHGIFGYADPLPELDHLVVQQLEEEYHWRIDPSWLVWLPGLVPAIHAACRATGSVGESIMTCIPAYPPFLKAVPAAGRRLVTVPVQRIEGRWRIDMPALEQAVRSDTRLFLLCNPYNPVGRVLERDELSALDDFARRHALIVLSDEIHCGLVLDPQRRHIPLASLDPATARRCITLMAPSKTYNLPGLGCAFAVIPDSELRRAFSAAAEGIVPPVGPLGFAAALAAYQHGAAWRRDLIATLRANRECVMRHLSAMPGLDAAQPEATYLAWIDARGSGIATPAAFFEAAGVGLFDGAPFGSPGFLRLNFGCPRTVLEQALERMARALRSADSCRAAASGPF